MNKYTRLLLKRLTGQSEKDERYSDKGAVYYLYTPPKLSEYLE
ncbi:hypothetical protein BSP36_246 [Bacillus phage BSP36]|uniref:Uncharacterized protein n=1 Tax=Bacillus phage BSP38 TaxID=2283013 RepID=A0A345MKB4_BPBSP|nr:hypothetical protein HWB82_gp064 [Bacillus phage BSP38]AXH71296.1 hypothetical protein BSP38_254 [Bacillus phage BSP38]AYJ75333.1 hypothetical protein BSP36_246 [Bacillus phage BSP36]